MTALTLGLMQAPASGWDSAATIGAARRRAWSCWSPGCGSSDAGREPLVDPAVLRGPMLGANFVAFCVPFVLTGLAVLLAIYLQNVLGYSALETGVLMLPMTIPLCSARCSPAGCSAGSAPARVVTGGMLVRRGRRLPGRRRAPSRDEYLPLLPGLVALRLRRRARAALDDRDDHGQRHAPPDAAWSRASTTPRGWSAARSASP